MPYNIKIPKADLIAKISFAIFMFFVFFSTSLPFQDTMQDIGSEELATSNIVNQLLYPVLFLLSLIAFLSNTDKVIQIIKREKFLALFLIYALISITWSAYPVVSLKRWFQLTSYYFVVVVLLSYSRDVNLLLKLIKPVLFAYIIISIFAVLLIPQAYDPLFGTWRGLAATKNNLGQIGIVSSILSLIIYIKENNRLRKYIAFIIVVFSLTLTVGTFSSTTFTALFVFLAGTFLFLIKNRIFGEIGVGNFLFFFSLIAFLTLTVLILIFYPELIDSIQSIFGKEGSFADRDKLWQVLLYQISQHVYLGCGFQGFWITDSPTIELLYKTFVWLPIQAHNGYLDLLNETGIIGLSIFLSIIIKYFYLVTKNNQLSLWNWFIVLPLIMNITESVVFRIGNIMTVFFIVSYLSIHSIHSKH